MNNLSISVHVHNKFRLIFDLKCKKGFTQALACTTTLIWESSLIKLSVSSKMYSGIGVFLVIVTVSTFIQNNMVRQA